MADFSKFRSALGGFNREDVANFIESQSIAHQKELRALREENAKLTAERDEARQALAALQEQAAAAAEAGCLLYTSRFDGNDKAGAIAARCARCRTRAPPR